MHKIERAIAVHDAWVAAGRPGALADLCAAHPDLAEHIEALAADPVEVDRAIAADGPTGKRLGDFRLIGELGRGGMGVVYLAKQVSLDREVAVKVLPHHLTLQPTTIARFRREANLAARLEHPGIVAIHAVGRDGDAHWFAMERIDGERLSRTDPRTGQQRSVRQCAELAAAVADALAHAHGHGVLHRDVKPSNILVRRDGQPVLTDFGLARELGTERITKTGHYAGTPVYSAPEQISGGKDVDGRADVWSLGATLYELLTDRVPFDGDSEHEVLDRIRNDEPTDPLRLVPELAPDLAAIVLKALEKDPARRYASAAAFRDDLRAFLEYRPVTARRASRLQRAGRWLQRHPGWRAALVVVAVGLLAMPWFVSAVRADERDRAVAAEQQARVQAYAANVLAAHTALATGDIGQAAQRVAACPEDLRGFEWNLVAGSLDRSLWSVATGSRSIESVALSRDAQRLVVGDDQGEIALHDAGDATPRWRRRVGAAAVDRLAIDDGARFVLAATKDGGVRSFDLATGQCLGEHAPAGMPNAVAFAPDASAVVRAVGGGRYVVSRAPLLDGEQPRDLAVAGDRPRERFVSDGRTMLGVVLTAAMARWDLADGARAATWRCETMPAMLCADRSLTRALGYDDVGGFAWWTVGEPEGVRVHPDRRTPTCLAMAPDGAQFAAGCQSGDVLVYATQSPRLARVLQGHRTTVRSVAAADNGWLATGGSDGVVKLWNTLLDAGAGEFAGAPSDPSLSNDGSGHSLAVGADAMFVGALNGTVRSIDRRTGEVRWQVQLPHWINGLALADDGRTLVAHYYQNAQRLAAADGALLGTPLDLSAMAYARRMAASPDGRQIAILDVRGSVGLFDPAAGQLIAHRPVCRLQEQGANGGLAWTADGAELLVGGDDGVVRALAAATLATRREFAVDGVIGSLAVDDDAVAVAVWDRERKQGRLRKLALADGRLLVDAELTAQVVAMAVLPDRLALARWDGRLTLCRRSDLQPMLELPQPARSLWNVMAGPSGDWLGIQCYGGNPRILAARALQPSLAECRELAIRATGRNLAGAALRPTNWAPHARAALLRRSDLAPAVREAAVAALPPVSEWRLREDALHHALSTDRSPAHLALLQLMHDCLVDADDETGALYLASLRVVRALVEYRLDRHDDALATIAALPPAELATSWWAMLAQFVRANVAAARGDGATARAAVAELEATVLRHPSWDFGPDLLREARDALAK
jgi:WD40 repeat protein